MGHDGGAGRHGDLDGIVVAAAVDHDALVAKCDALEARRNVCRLVPGNDDRTQHRVIFFQAAILRRSEAGSRWSNQPGQARP